MKTTVIIPARGGSKGIPRKNLIDFAGKPLLAWTVEQALASELVDEVCVTSNSEEILQVAAQCGAQTILRPQEISGDRDTSESALIHALDQLSEAPDVVVFLQVTSPLRLPGDIDASIRTLHQGGFDSVFSGSRVIDFNLWQESEGKLESVNYDFRDRKMRQDKDFAIYVENGSVYVFTPDILLNENNRLGGKIGVYSMEQWQAFEIDEPDDVGLCEWLFNTHVLHQAPNQGSEQS